MTDPRTGRMVVGNGYPSMYQTNLVKQNVGRFGERFKTARRAMIVMRWVVSILLRGVLGLQALLAAPGKSWCGPVSCRRSYEPAGRLFAVVPDLSDCAIATCYRWGPRSITRTSVGTVSWSVVNSLWPGIIDCGQEWSRHSRRRLTSEILA
jgi:hypothetical protein